MDVSNIVEAWEDMRIVYQQRYVKYLREYDETKSEYARGHLNECSWVLTGIYNLTDKQIKELEHNYSGLTNADIEEMNY